MKKLYSLVIHPPKEILISIQSMKERLATEIGWYNSKNAVGHITICEFKASDSTIESIKEQINQLADTLNPISVTLNKFGSFPNGAFFIAPNIGSKKDLQHIMKQFNLSLKVQEIKKSDNPHLSIARRLSPEKLLKANQLFTSIDLNFVCDSVVLRLFDDTKKQFFVIETFPFNSSPEPQLIQGTLF